MAMSKAQIAADYLSDIFSFFLISLVFIFLIALFGFVPYLWILDQARDRFEAELADFVPSYLPLLGSSNRSGSIDSIGFERNVASIVSGTTYLDWWIGGDSWVECYQVTGNHKKTKYMRGKLGLIERSELHIGFPPDIEDLQYVVFLQWRLSDRVNYRTRVTKYRTFSDPVTSTGNVNYETYDLLAWVVDIDEKRVVAHQEFAARPLKDSYGSENVPCLPMDKYRDWIRPPEPE